MGIVSGNRGHSQPESTFLQQQTTAFQLAVACCTWPLDMPRVQQAADAQVDWSEFLAVVKRHRIPGLACRALGPVNGIPEQIRQTLSTQARANTFANLRCIGLHAQLDTEFRRCSIQYAVLKGIPLSQQLYGDNSLRHSRDIDLLVALHDFEAAENVLLQTGLRRTEPDKELSPQFRELWFKRRHHFSYVHPQHGITVELHWRLYDNIAVDPGPCVLQDIEQVMVSPGISLPVLRREYLLLNLLVHGAGHAWCRLKWIADVSALLAGFSANDRDLLLQQARIQGIEPACRQGLAVCEALELLPPCDIPRPTATVRWLVSVALRAVLQDEPAGGGNFLPRHQMLSRFTLSPRSSYWLHELQVQAFSAEDRRMFPLPRWLTFAYPLLRAPFWLIRRFRFASR